MGDCGWSDVDVDRCSGLTADKTSTDGFSGVTVNGSDCKERVFWPRDELEQLEPVELEMDKLDTDTVTIRITFRYCFSVVAPSSTISYEGMKRASLKM